VRAARLALLAIASYGCAGAPQAPRSNAGFALAPDGVRIAYDVRGQGEPTLVLVHGWCCDRSFWRGQVDSLARDYRVVTLDLAGHGDSGHERASWSVDVLAGDVVAVADALDLRRIVLIGHSMGGPVSLAAAARLPGRAIAVIGVDTLHDAEMVWPAETFDEFAARYEADFEGTMRALVRPMVSARAGDDVVDWIVSRALRTDRNAALALVRAFPSVDARALLAGAGVPVRCINAGKPADAPPPHTRIDVNRKYADYDAVMLDGVGHYPMLEQPPAFEAALRHALGALARE
jgi:pimeloyl-ACP methyl ester carboxylesterase